MVRTSDTKQRLVKTAFSLMFSHGYNAVGVQEICQQAGVNKGSFYYFFPSKRHLALAVLEFFWEMYQRRFLESAFAEDVSLNERFRRFFELTCQPQGLLVDEEGRFRGCPLGNFALELSMQDEAIRQKLQAIFQEWTHYFERILSQAVSSGELPEIDTQATAQAILAYYEGTLMLAKTYNDTDFVDRLAQAALQLAISNAP